MDDDYKLKLKPCPFCGGKAVLKIKGFDIFNNAAFVTCLSCGVSTRLIPQSSEYVASQEAAAIWNRREQENDYTLQS